MDSAEARKFSELLPLSERFFSRGFSNSGWAKLSSSGAAGLGELAEGREFSGMDLRNKLLGGQFKT
jgi:hypothetical protein